MHWGCLGRVCTESGVPSPPKMGLWSLRAGRPLPHPEAQAVLSLRSWTRQHSCRRCPLPPACLNLAPASGDPALPPPTGTGLWDPAGEGPVCWDMGRPALVKGTREDVYREDTEVRGVTLWRLVGMGQSLIRVRVREWRRSGKEWKGTGLLVQGSNRSGLLGELLKFRWMR